MTPFGWYWLSTNLSKELAAPKCVACSTLQDEEAASSEVSVSVYNIRGVVSQMIESVIIIAFRTLNITQQRYIKFKLAFLKCTSSGIFTYLLQGAESFLRS